jgi:tRNA threonylcarbamoyl adenosine modification protein YeaZ
MKILALELSTARGTLAWLDGALEFAREWPNDRRNSAAFFRSLQEVHAKFGAPETIIVGLGPGSYAGTRIAISAAIGLQLSSQARLIGWPSIGAMETDAAEYSVVGDARRASFFMARIVRNEMVETPRLFSGPDLKAKLETMDRAIPVFCSEVLPQFDRAVIRYPSALVLAKVAQDPRQGFFLPPLEPIYLREPHITLPRAGT